MKFKTDNKSIASLAEEKIVETELSGARLVLEKSKAKFCSTNDNLGIRKLKFWSVTIL